MPSEAPADASSRGRGVARATEADLQREALRAERARQQLQLLQRNADGLGLVIQERERALATLRGLGHGDEIMIPVGAGTFLRGRVADSKKLLRSVGGGVVLERSTSEAIAELEKESEELQAQTQRIVAAAQRVADEADDAESRAEEILAGLQRGPTAGTPVAPPKLRKSGAEVQGG
jgi:prefoldin alpha subunit